MSKYYLISEEELHNLIVAKMENEMNDRDGVDNWEYYGMSYDEIANEFNPDDIEYEDLDFNDVAAAHIKAYYNEIEMTEKEPTKSQIKKMKINALTQAFLDGSVWLEHTGFVLNRDNFVEFARKKGVSEGMPHTHLAKKFIEAAYSSSKHYFGWTWTLKGECKFE